MGYLRQVQGAFVSSNNGGTSSAMRIIVMGNIVLVIIMAFVTLMVIVALAASHLMILILLVVIVSILFLVAIVRLTVASSKLDWLTFLAHFVPIMAIRDSDTMPLGSPAGVNDILSYHMIS